MIRRYTTLFLLFISTPFLGQGNYLQNFTCNTEIELLGDSLKITQQFDIPPTHDTLSLKFWPLDYSNRKSFIGQQLLEDQEAKAYFSIPRKTTPTVVSVNGVNHNIEGSSILVLPNRTNSTLISWQKTIPIPQTMPNGFGQQKEELLLFNLLSPPQITSGESPISNNLKNLIPEAPCQHQITVIQEGKIIHKRSYTTNTSFFRLAPDSIPIPPLNQIEYHLKSFGFPQIKDLSQKIKPHYFKGFIPGNLEEIPVRYYEDTALFQAEIVASIVKHFLTNQGIDPTSQTWMIEGFSGFMKNNFLQTYYPHKKLLGPYAQSLPSRFFDLHSYPPNYLNQYFYTFLARENLDAPMALRGTEHAKLGYQSTFQGKSVQFFQFIHHWIGDKNFKRGMHRWQQQETKDIENFWASQKYFSFQDFDWVNDFFLSNNYKTDYALKKVEYCTSVYTATVKNRGQNSPPYTITGYRDEKEIVTLSYEGHKGTKTQQFHLEDYDYLEVNAPGYFPEINYKNNLRKTTGIFKGFKPLRLQFYTSLENPNKTQVFWLPSLKYNAYDKALIGFQIYNTTLVPKEFEYRLAPDFSTGTGKLTGIVNFKYNRLLKGSPFRKISFGIYSRYFHYQDDLSFFRVSPAVNFYFRKPHPRSPLIRKFTLRMVSVDKETPFGVSDIDLPSYQYTITNLKYHHENGHALHPSLLTVNAEFGNSFSKVSVDFQQRYRLSLNQWFRYRLFAGKIFQNVENTNYFDFYAQRPTDYLFDHYYIGRSDTTGIWSQQIFTVDGGMRGYGPNLPANNWLTGFNADFVFWRHFGVFGDVNFSNNFWTYDAGLSFILVPEFLEIYYAPINGGGYRNNTNPLEIPNVSFGQQIRFVLNFDLDDAITRIRRGYF